MEPVFKRNCWMCFRTVEPEYASVAGMFGAASIVTGIVVGLVFSHLVSIL